MTTEASHTQAEPRDKVVGVTCTASEKRAVRFVADVLGIPESDVMREHTMSDVVERFESMRAKLGIEKGAAA